MADSLQISVATAPLPIFMPEPDEIIFPTLAGVSVLLSMIVTAPFRLYSKKLF
jgi:hypothetical protein